MVFINKYKEIRNRCNYSDLDPLGFLVNEINYFLSTLLFFIFIYFKTKPNFIDLLSIAFTITASIFILTRIELLFILGTLVFLVVDVWDLVDGQVARYQNTDSIDGEFIDVACQTFNHDIIIITFAIYNIMFYEIFLVSIISIILIYSRLTRLTVYVNHLRFISKKDLKTPRVSAEAGRLEVKPNHRKVMKLRNIVNTFFYRQYIKYFILFLILDFYFLDNVLIIPATIIAVLQSYKRIRDWRLYLTV